MNKERRKMIEKVVSKLYDLREQVESIMDEEQEAFDNMPESLQETERGERMQEVVDALDSACYDIDNIIDNLNEATE